MRIAAFLLLFMGGPTLLWAQGVKSYSVASPGGVNVVQVNVGEKVQWTVSHRGEVVLAPSDVAVSLKGGMVLGRGMKGTTARKSSVSAWILPLHYKKDSIADRYSQLELSFDKGSYGLIFRAYDDGVAYRWWTHFRDSLVVMGETADFNFPSDEMGWIPYINEGRPDLFSTSFESLYQHIKVSEFKKDTIAFLPVVVGAGTAAADGGGKMVVGAGTAAADGGGRVVVGAGTDAVGKVDGGEERKVAILEADLEDYPGMFLGAGHGGGVGLSGVFAPYPLEERQGGHNQLQSLVVRRADHIATIAGQRQLPWRVLVVSDKDRDLLDNDMVYRLAAPSRLQDPSWIRPGKVAWDWWNDWNISHVDFRAGINTPTYKYYIDFAAANHIPYILLDEGWADSKDIMKVVPDIDLPAIVEYGRQKNVGVWLWGGWLPLDQKIDEALGHYSQIGIKGFKIDFMDRDDQKMVEFYYRMSAKAAQYHLMLDFHGAYKPTGLQRTWPNVMNFEGVRGMENEKWANDDFPKYDATIPFVRMLAGPMDYTPGAMKNYNKKNYRPINAEPESQGTRCHQLAMYVVYEAPFSMLADNPTNYMRERESVDLISSVPEVFDQTVALDGKIGEFAAVARRRGTEWWIGALGDWNARTVAIDFSFLGPGSYEVEVFKDGINADRDGTDYKKETITVTAATKMDIRLSEGGGWVARVKPAAAASR